MARHFRTLILAASCALALVACGGKDTTPVAEKSTDTGG